MKNNRSKYLALILRHKPELVNLELMPNGWVQVVQLLNNVSEIHQGQNQHEPELQRRTGDFTGRHDVFIQRAGNAVQEAGQIQKEDINFLKKNNLFVRFKVIVQKLKLNLKSLFLQKNYITEQQKGFLILF